MQFNADNGGNRKFILVQLPEICDPGSKAAKAGYKNICEIGKERISRAGEKIKKEAGMTAQNLDIGFRVLKLDDTNMKDVYYAAGEYTQRACLQVWRATSKMTAPIWIYSTPACWTGASPSLCLTLRKR